jgi:glycosyltransferase 2 family protein
MVESNPVKSYVWMDPVKAAASETRRKRFLILHWIALLLVIPLLLYYIYHQLHEGWDQLENLQWSLDFGYLFLSILVALLYFALGSWIWQRILFCLGSDLTFWKAYRILQIAQLGKYLPGRLGAVVGQLYLGAQEGVSVSTLFWATGLHWLYNLVSGAVILLPFLSTFAPRWVTVSMTLAVLVASIFVIFPRLILQTVARWVRLADTGKFQLGFLRLSASQNLIIFLSFFFAWTLFGFAFWCFVNALLALPLTSYYQLLSSFCGAWILGAVSFFTPAGIGVREGVMVYLLGQFLLPSMAVLISVAARLWLTVMELLCAAIASFIR